MIAPDSSRSDNTIPSDPFAAALCVTLDNQIARMHAALEDLPQEAYDAEQPNDCNSIRAIGAHLITLCRFQLILLESELAESIPDDHAAATPAQLRELLGASMQQVRRAIADHDPADWLRVPAAPREGNWGDEPTAMRFVRPFNDLVNHLGAIRALRRVMGVPNERTQ